MLYRVLDKLPSFTREPSSYAGGVPNFGENKDVISFGSQWTEHSKTQLDSFTGSTITEDRTRRMFGNNFHNLENALVLEAGSGSGRFTEVLLKQGAKVFSFDLSEAVTANYANNGSHHNLVLFRAAIENLPFSGNTFDFVFCPGVLQHTKNPEKSLKTLYGHLRPGGFLVFDQYRINLSSLLRSTWIFRLFLKRMNPINSKKVIYAIVDALLPIHKLFSRWKFAEVLLFRISPITCHYRGYPFLSEELQKLWSRLASFDNLTDKYKRLVTLPVLRRRILRLGVSYCVIRVMPYTIEVICKKVNSGERSIKKEEIVYEWKKSSRNVSG
jgi:SAM-dependent methyltransferase